MPGKKQITGLNNAQRIAILDAGLEFEKVGNAFKRCPHYWRDEVMIKGGIANIL